MNRRGRSHTPAVLKSWAAVSAKIVSVALSLALAMALLPIATVKAYADDYLVTDLAGLQAALDVANDGDVITIGGLGFTINESITINRDLVVAAGAILTIYAPITMQNMSFSNYGTIIINSAVAIYNVTATTTGNLSCEGTGYFTGGIPSGITYWNMIIYHEKLDGTGAVNYQLSQSVAITYSSYTDVGFVVPLGFEFWFWLDDRQFAGSGQFHPGGTFNGDPFYGFNSFTLYPYFMPRSSVTYTVTYDANGGEIYGHNWYVDPDEYAAGNPVNVISDEPVRFGYAFMGWLYNGGTYFGGDGFTMPADNVTLSALWTAKSDVTVTYHYNWSSSDPAPYVDDNLTFASKYTVLSFSPGTSGWTLPAGYHFIGWYDSAYPDLDVDAPITEIDPLGYDNKLYAQYAYYEFDLSKETVDGIGGPVYIDQYVIYRIAIQNKDTVDIVGLVIEESRAGKYYRSLASAQDAINGISDNFVCDTAFYPYGTLPAGSDLLELWFVSKVTLGDAIGREAANVVRVFESSDKASYAIELQPTTLVLTGVKTVTSGKLSEDLFSFTITDEDDTVVATGEMDAFGAITFTEIILTEIGIFSFTASEDTPLPPGWSSNTGPITFYVKVVDNRDGTLAATAYRDDALTVELEAAPLTFSNSPIAYNIYYVLDGGTHSQAPATYTMASSFPIGIANPTRAGWEFTGWNVDYANDALTDLVDQIDFGIPAGTTGNITLTANWVQLFTVTFINWDGAVLGTQIVRYGGNATAPYVPPRAGYSFTGWDKGFAGITENTTVYALFAAVIVTPEPLPTYTVTYDPGARGTFTAQATSGLLVGAATPAAPATTGQAGWRFTGWSPAPTATVAGSVTYVAQWAQESYTVRFVDYNGTVLKTETVLYGGNATAPTSPTRANYNFTGWDRTYTNVTADITVNAQYTAVPPPPSPPPDNTKIEDTTTPTTDGAAWALVNLILTVIGILVAFVLLMAFYIKRKNEDDSRGHYEQEKKRLWPRVLAALFAMGAIVLFLVTENMKLPMTYTDRWTIWHAVLLVAVIVFTVVASMRKKTDEGERQDPRQHVAE